MQDLLTKELDFNELRTRVDDYLSTYINQLDGTPTRLHDAIKYVVLSGGKRLRPLLVYTIGLALGAELEDLDRPAAAVELIHAYSLTHDDLPAMDDDELRRGKPTCHIAYDEATAILAGDALQCLAFELLTEPYATTLNVETRLKIINYLSRASGAQGMAGGQSLDLLATGQIVTLNAVETIHNLKTGRLIAASIMIGAFCTPASSKLLKTLEEFANKIGLAYQIHDDILDIESTTEELGKTQGSDINQNKATYPRVVGLEESKTMRDWLCAKATSLLKNVEYDVKDIYRLVNLMIQRRN